MNKHYIFIAVLCFLALTLIIVTVLVAGTPSEQKAIAQDRERLSAFNAIDSQIKSYSRTNGLPQSLSQVPRLTTDYYIDQIKDPETEKIYDYRVVTNSSYQLCTTFSANSTNQDKYTKNELSKNNNNFTKGYSCLTYDVEIPAVKKNINPTKTPSPTPTKTPAQLKALRDAEERDLLRRNNISEINSLFRRYIKNNQGNFPGGLSNSSTYTKKISSSDANICADLTTQLTVVTEKRKTALPIDPSLNKGDYIEDCNANYDTGYTIYYNGKSEITIEAPLAELSRINSTGLTTN